MHTHSTCTHIQIYNLYNVISVIAVFPHIYTPQGSLKYVWLMLPKLQALAVILSNKYVFMVKYCIRLYVAATRNVRNSTYYCISATSRQWGQERHCHSRRLMQRSELIVRKKALTLQRTEQQLKHEWMKPMCSSRTEASIGPMAVCVSL